MLGRTAETRGTFPLTPIDLVSCKSIDIKTTAYLWLLIENGKSVLFTAPEDGRKESTLDAFSPCFTPNNDVLLPDADHDKIIIVRDTIDANQYTNLFSGTTDNYQQSDLNLQDRPGMVVDDIEQVTPHLPFEMAASGHTVLASMEASSASGAIDRLMSDPHNLSAEQIRSFDVVVHQRPVMLEDYPVTHPCCCEVVEIPPSPEERDNKKTRVDSQPVFTRNRDTATYQLEVNGDADFTEQSIKLTDVQRNHGWSNEELNAEVHRRETVLAYLINNSLNRADTVATTFQAYMTAPESVLRLIANGTLADNIERLQSMDAVDIDLDPEYYIVRPLITPAPDLYEQTEAILDHARKTILASFDR